MEKGFLIFLVSYKGTGDLCIPSTTPGTQERWDPALVSYHVRSSGTLPGTRWCVYSLSHHFPHPLASWPNVVIFCPAMFIFPSFSHPLLGRPEDIPWSQGRSHYALIQRNAFGSRVLSFESGFPFHYPPFLSLCQASGEGFKEFPEGTFGKWLILFAEILSVYKTSICNLVVMSLSIYLHCVKILFLFLSSSPLPMGFLF